MSECPFSRDAGQIFVIMIKMAAVFSGLVLIVLIACCYGDLQCPRGWLANDDSCYLFAHYPMPYNEAKSYCDQHHSRLVEVHSINTNAFIKDQLVMHNTRHWWLGMTDKATTGVWQWENTHGVANYTDWYKGHPLARADYCAYFAYTVGFQWATTLCTTASPAPICEKMGATCIPSAEVIG